MKESLKRNIQIIMSSIFKNVIGSFSNKTVKRSRINIDYYFYFILRFPLMIEKLKENRKTSMEKLPVINF